MILLKILSFKNLLNFFLTNKNKHLKNFIIIILITGLYLYFKIIIHKNELQYS